MDVKTRGRLGMVAGTYQFPLPTMATLSLPMVFRFRKVVEGELRARWTSRYGLCSGLDRRRIERMMAGLCWCSTCGMMVYVLWLD